MVYPFSLQPSAYPIRIGNQTSFSVSPELPFEYAVKNGFNAFEWFPDKQASGIGWDLDDINSDTRAYIKKAALKSNINLTVHAPWRANPLSSEGKEVILNDFNFARDINATLVNIHLYTDKGLGNYVKSIIPLIKRSKEFGIKLAIENTTITTSDDFNKMFVMLRNINGVKIENIGMCLDIGHANLCGLTQNDYIAFVDQIVSDVPIIHIHLHENYGDHDNHLPLFTGPSQNNDSGICALVERLKKRGFSGSIILEQWPQPPSLLNHARDRLYQIFNKEK